jgi:hypothetical protein
MKKRESETNLRLGLGVVARVWIGLILRVVLWQAPQTEQAVAVWAFMQSGVAVRSPAALLALIRLLLELRVVRGARGGPHDALCPLRLAPSELGLAVTGPVFKLRVKVKQLEAVDALDISALPLADEGLKAGVIVVAAHLPAVALLPKMLVIMVIAAAFRNAHGGAFHTKGLAVNFINLLLRLPLQKVSLADRAKAFLFEVGRRRRAVLADDASDGQGQGGAVVHMQGGLGGERQQGGGLLLAVSLTQPQHN